MADRPSITHKAVGASAGSGKTYKLSSRYISLLALGVSPTRIVALTFTKKAAGEIFIRIVQRLAGAALRGDDLRELNQSLEQGTDPLDNAHVIHVLRSLIMATPNLRIGTLDSFFFSVLQAFPFEFNISGALDMMDDAALAAARVRVLHRILLSGAMPEHEVKALFQAYKQISYGQESKTVMGTLLPMIEANHELYLSAADETLWGDPGAIWSAPIWWKSDRPFEQEDREALIRSLNRRGAKKEQIDFFKEFVDDVLAYVPGMDMTKRIDYFLSRLMPNLAAVRDGAFSVIVARTMVDLDEEACKHTLHLLQTLIDRIYQAQCERTRGLFHILREYEQHYDRQVRRAGVVHFADILYLLNADLRGVRRPPLLSRSPDQDQQRLYIDYRLDGAFDHWLLDEFQDTSTPQWNALTNLAEEIYQDTEGRRSFYYVGDVKQAIYGWRKGDANLFDLLPQRFPVIDTSETLSQSWRSSPVVLEAVNCIFDLERLNERSGYAEWMEDPCWVNVRARWETHWRKHSAAAKNRVKPGFVVHAHLPKPANAHEGEDARFAATAALIRQLPLRGSLGIAVLVRSNRAGLKATHYLREQGINAVWEGSVSIADNGLASAFLSLIKYAEYPGDTYARKHIAMSPLSKVMKKRGLNFDKLAPELLHTIYNQGYAPLIRAWLHAAGMASCEDAFTRECMRHLLEAAALFDQQGRKKALEFIGCIRQYCIEDQQASAGAVHVLTMHKAKGLEYDAVFLPELQGRNILSSGGLGLAVKTHREHTSRVPDWALYMPNRLFVKNDPDLSAYLRELDQDHAFESLCLLYVAMTRAKSAIYLVTSECNHRKTMSPASLLLTQWPQDAEPETVDLDGQPAMYRYRAGDDTWHAAAGDDSSEQPAPPLPVSFQGLRNRKARRNSRMMCKTPSGEKSEPIKASMLFNRREAAILEFGSAMHALLEQVQWLNRQHPDDIIAAWKTAYRPAPELEHEAIDDFRRLIEFAHVREALSNPGFNGLLWREKPFEIEWNKQWISGCFDRVTILLNQDGSYQRADIIDYKTSSGADQLHVALEYKDQLDLYRKVLGHMLSLPLDQITARILLTRTGEFINPQDLVTQNQRGRKNAANSGQTEMNLGV